MCYIRYVTLEDYKGTGVDMKLALAPRSASNAATGIAAKEKGVAGAASSDERKGSVGIDLSLLTRMQSQALRDADHTQHALLTVCVY